MDELECMEDVLNAELLEEFLHCREHGTGPELQWLSLHPDLAEEFGALGRICDQLAGIHCTQTKCPIESVQEEVNENYALPMLPNISTKAGIMRLVKDSFEKPISLN